MQNSKPLLIFDFDGVISDSIHDSFATSLNAFVRSAKDLHPPLDKPVDPPCRIFDFEKRHPELFDEFRRLIPLGNRAEDYYVLWHAISTGRADGMRSQTDFNDIFRTMAEETLDAYAEVFYGLRRKLQNQDVKGWIQLSPVFNGIPEAIEDLSDRFDLAIATSKDLRSVNLLLESYGLVPFFRPEFVLDKDFSYSKRDHLRHFHENFNVPFGRMHFIDDKLLHLISIRDLGVNGYLALWGYNTERECVLAEKEGFRLLNLADLKNF